MERRIPRVSENRVTFRTETFHTMRIRVRNTDLVCRKGIRMPTDKLSFRTESRAAETVVFLAGELDLEVASRMRAAMEPLLPLADRRLTLNLRELKYIDSTGIGILIGIVKARHARGAAFGVEEVPAHILKLFDITGMTSFLTAAATAEGTERK